MSEKIDNEQAAGLSREQRTAVIDWIKKKTEKQAICINIVFEKQPSLFSSKIGGVPYWNPDMPYPKANTGEKLTLLAQFNMSELPENNVFPKEGMLQFFTLANDLYGMPFEDSEYGNAGYKVVFHRSLRTDVSQEEIEALGITTSFNLNEERDEIYPVIGEFAVDFKTESIFMNDNDIQFSSLMYEAAEKLGIELEEDTDLYELFEEDEEEYDRFYSATAGHWLLGYPFFTQWDPRTTEELRKKYDTVLFQLDSDWKQEYPEKEILWGDSGVGAFFINSEDLARMDFDDVLYSWDCC